MTDHEIFKKVWAETEDYRKVQFALMALCKYLDIESTEHNVEVMFETLLQAQEHNDFESS